MKKRKNTRPEEKRGNKKARVNVAASFLGDRGGRRLGMDRRRFSYTHHIPERRSGKERRSIRERRGELDYRMILKWREEKERRAAFLRLRDHTELGDLEMILTEGEDLENNETQNHSNEHKER